MTTLESGAKGEEVKTLQKILKEQGVFKGAVRGNFLKLTRAAVVAFQQTHSGPKGKSPCGQTGWLTKTPGGHCRTSRTRWPRSQPSDMGARANR